MLINDKRIHKILHVPLFIELKPHALSWVPGPGVGVFEEREILQWTLLLFNVCKSVGRVFCNLAELKLG